MPRSCGGVGYAAVPLEDAKNLLVELLEWRWLLLACFCKKGSAENGGWGGNQEYKSINGMRIKHILRGCACQRRTAC